VVQRALPARRKEGTITLKPLLTIPGHWRAIYLTTDENGNAAFIDNVTTGEYGFIGRAFVVHGDDGSPVYPAVYCCQSQSKRYPQLRLLLVQYGSFRHC
jgi:hypothetical protein